MIQFLYSSGLRVSELINLKIKELEIDKKYGFVRSGKGNKDRLFIIANKILFDIIRLIKDENLEEENYLFTSNRKEKYSDSTPRKIIQDSAKKSGINKKIGCHTLRHSFATHLIENDYSLFDVQSLLGHKSPETTQIYVHIASKNLINITSPLDS
jgi:site-specific recombinase XerD